MSAKRDELTRIAARLFAERGYQGTSLADLAEALGLQKPSLYHHIESKEDLLWEAAWEGHGPDPPRSPRPPGRRRGAARRRNGLRPRMAVPLRRPAGALRRRAPP